MAPDTAASTVAAPSSRRLDDEEMREWVPVVRLANLLPQALDRRLREETGINHAHYSLLAILAGQPDRRLLMGELARLAGASPSRLTHAVSALQSRGWLDKRACEYDGRSQYAHLTDEGLDALRAAAPAHIGQVRQLFFDTLDATERDELRRISVKLLAALDDPAVPAGS